MNMTEDKFTTDELPVSCKMYVTFHEYGMSGLQKYQNILHEHTSKIISTKALLHPI